MVLFLVGMQNIPTELYDAARVYGAGAFQQFRHVTLPGLRHVLTVAVVVTVTSAFRSFDLVFVMTQGGPGNASAVPAWQVYRRAFFYGQIGSAAALGVTLGILILLIVLILNRPRRERAMSRRRLELWLHYLTIAVFLLWILYPCWASSSSPS